jgi:hypothetical protein
LELLQARTGRGLVEISQAIAQLEESHLAAKIYPSAQSFLEIERVAQTEFQRWVDRAVADLCILLGAGNLNRKRAGRLAALELGAFAERIKIATRAEAFRDVVPAQSISAEHHKYALVLTAKLRCFEHGAAELPKVVIEESGPGRNGSHDLARRSLLHGRTHRINGARG